MELHTAVKKMMLTVKIEGIIPESAYPLMRDYLTQMYAVGYDAGYQEINQHGNKPLTQSRNGRAINTFKSLEEAVKRTGFSESGIRRSITRGTPMRQGWTWEYTPKVKEPKYQLNT